MVTSLPTRCTGAELQAYWFSDEATGMFDDVAADRRTVFLSDGTSYWAPRGEVAQAQTTTTQETP